MSVNSGGFQTETTIGNPTSTAMSVWLNSTAFAIETKRWHKKNRIVFHHDNERPHVCRPRAVECIANKVWELLTHLPLLNFYASFSITVFKNA
ncbi:hypothetical protein CDAR_374901 [Caerostris darwini]|uniref:Uncharacterized protein n=1 Tax=Caerostris darwini TaxID=1538125 RepID=A0AAV4RLR1_9ARAC|nr:hypothetical protein CDAR_374901 [Caerostris darwini]